MTILGPDGQPAVPRRLPLAARDGWPIPNEIGYDWNPVQVRAIVQDWQQRRPCARLRSISGIYNCLGMVFASRRTFIDDMTLLRAIFLHDGYRQVGPPPEAVTGDVVVYRNHASKEPTHVGIIMVEPNVSTAAFDVTVLSKWGHYGEYLHPLDCVPDAYGAVSEYWTERVTV